MQTKTLLARLVIVLLAVFGSIEQSVAANLSVSWVGQKTSDPNGNPIGDNWCWDACTKMILDYNGYPTSLFDIAGYGLGSSTYDTGNCLSGSGTESRSGVEVWVHTTTGWVRKKLTVTLNWHGVRECLTHFTSGGIDGLDRNVISADAVDKEINSNSAPFVLAIRWKNILTRADEGGHAIVCYGYNTSSQIMSINDPWFGPYVKTYDGMVNGNTPAARVDSTVNDFWVETLTTSKALDLLFLIDTTGSMGPYIYNVQANLSATIDQIAANFKNYRIAIADYKDLSYYAGGPGGYYDYTYQADQDWTTDADAAKAAVNSLYASGGGDIPEAVFSALYDGISGNGIGSWRPDPVRRMIIVIGDAPGHDPEPWAGGHSFADVIPYANAQGISISCINPGYAFDTDVQFAQISATTGGALVDATDIGTSAAINQIVQTVSENPNFPQGDTSGIYPKFTFSPAGKGGMFTDATAIFLQVQLSNTVRKAWVNYKLINIGKPTNTTWTSTTPYPVGTYRWHVGFMRPATTLFLPSRTNSVTVPATITYPSNWTAFNRVSSPPGPITIISPKGDTTPSSTKVTYSFGAVAGATSYAVRVFQNGKLWRTLTVVPPRSNPHASVLTVTVLGHNLNDYYYWEVQGLNYDRVRPDNSAWTYSY
ncbi:MAG: C39 family peptidase [Limisphaerales bacterium]